MAYEESLISITMEADASIGVFTAIQGIPGMDQANNPFGGKQYRFVKVVSKDTVGLATAGTDTVVGVLQNKPQQPGAAATVSISGVSLITAGTALNPGDKVAADSDGRAVAAGTNAALGVVIQPAGAADELIPVLLKL